MEDPDLADVLLPRSATVAWWLGRGESLEMAELKAHHYQGQFTLLCIGLGVPIVTLAIVILAAFWHAI